MASKLTNKEDDERKKQSFVFLSEPELRKRISLLFLVYLLTMKYMALFKHPMAAETCYEATDSSWLNGIHLDSRREGGSHF